VTVMGKLMPVDGSVPSSPEVDVLVRPEAVLVTPSPEGNATVVASSFRGSTARLRVRVGELEILSDVPGHDAVRLAPGTRVDVSLVQRPVLVAARTAPAPVLTPEDSPGSPGSPDSATPSGSSGASRSSGASESEDVAGVG